MLAFDFIITIPTSPQSLFILVEQRSSFIFHHHRLAILNIDFYDRFPIFMSGFHFFMTIFLFYDRNSKKGYNISYSLFTCFSKCCESKKAFLNSILHLVQMYRFIFFTSPSSAAANSDFTPSIRVRKIKLFF